MEILVLLTVLTVVAYAYGYWRLFADERPRYAPGTYRGLSASTSEQWERLTAGWGRQRPM